VRPAPVLPSNPASTASPITGAVRDLVSIDEIPCSRPVAVALADGDGGNAWRRIARAEFEAEAERCPAVARTEYRDARGDATAAQAQLHELTAAGVDAILLYADAGEVLLPAVRAATAAGVAVVVHGGRVGGRPGYDYTAAVNVGSGATVVEQGRTYARWLARALRGTGTVLHVGGAPGNAYSADIRAGVRGVVARHPGLALAAPLDTWWDPELTGEAVEQLARRGDPIDGIVADYGAAAIAALEALRAAGRPLVPVATEDANGLAGLWNAQREHHPGFQLLTTSSRTWITRVALRRALAATQGVPLAEPTELELPVVENSIRGGALTPRWDPALPDDAILSSALPRHQLHSLFARR
jgi:ribose transport system substrate-binding protein